MESADRKDAAISGANGPTINVPPHNAPNYGANVLEPLCVLGDPIGYLVPFLRRGPIGL